MNYRAILNKAETTHELVKDEIVTLLQNDSCQAELQAAADRVRDKYVGSAIHLRGLIEFSNICRQNCLYCGLRRDNQDVERYRMTPEEIVAMAAKAKRYGYKTVVLQSGEDSWFDIERFAVVLRQLKQLDLAITLSIGERTCEEYAAFKMAGADRFLLRIETTDKELYERMNPGMSLANRKRCLRDLKELGYEVGTGSLIGLPGQTVESIADDILFFKEIDADMLGIGPLVVNEQTPLAGQSNGSLDLALRVIAVVRLLLPDINIPATTAMETLRPDARSEALRSGANVVMPNVTEGDYRRRYVLYPGKVSVHDTPEECSDSMYERILAMGRCVSNTAGFRHNNRQVGNK